MEVFPASVFPRLWWPAEQDIELVGKTSGSILPEAATPTCSCISTMALITSFSLCPLPCARALHNRRHSFLLDIEADVSGTCANHA